MAWRAAVRAAGREVSWWAMVRALLSGIVPRRIWLERLEVCRRCPIGSQEGTLCRNVILGRPVGCGCYTPMLTLTAEPYQGGCWARAVGLEREGWPAYRKALHPKKLD